ncbi:alpha/beta-hydrolase [Earliella scabrosa]|nr:alpha/beta-hydrolase [Earliella scabrosa]
MDNALYKQTTVRRGHIYRYYASPATSGKPTLLFLHGYPSTSYDWHRQVEYFQPLGYGILAPDCLGAGGTAKPLDDKEYRQSAMAEDIVDILKAEGVDKVVGVSHDWGSVLQSRLSMLFPNMFYGFVWVSVVFMEPLKTLFNLEAGMAAAKAAFGIEAYAYWEFLCWPDAHGIIKKNVDCFLQITYPENPDCWKEYMVVRGKLNEAMEANIQLGRPSWLSDEEYITLRQHLLIDGTRGALNWYISQMHNNDLEDNLEIPEERKKLPAPSLVALPMRDVLCLPPLVKAAMTKWGIEVEYVELQAGHWAQLELSEEFNEAMHRWLERLSP